jgi:hypothetical protein
MFNGDMRKERVERVMTLASTLTLAEMKAVVQALTHLHDSIVLQKDPRWHKEKDILPWGETYSNNWEKEL